MRKLKKALEKNHPDKRFFNVKFDRSSGFYFTFRYQEESILRKLVTMEEFDNSLMKVNSFSDNSEKFIHDHRTVTDFHTLFRINGLDFDEFLKGYNVIYLHHDSDDIGLGVNKLNKIVNSFKDPSLPVVFHTLASLIPTQENIFIQRAMDIYSIEILNDTTNVVISDMIEVEFELHLPNDTKAYLENSTPEIILKKFKFRDLDKHFVTEENVKNEIIYNGLPCFVTSDIINKFRDLSVIYK